MRKITRNHKVSARKAKKIPELRPGFEMWNARASRFMYSIVISKLVDCQYIVFLINGIYHPIRQIDSS